jgi:hypothetical protein
MKGATLVFETGTVCHASIRNVLSEMVSEEAVLGVCQVLRKNLVARIASVQKDTCINE